MTKEQFYYCLDRICALRAKLFELKALPGEVDANSSADTDQNQINFEMLQDGVKRNTKGDRNMAAVRALKKELLAQEAKIRAYVPVALYGTRIEVSLPKLPLLYVVVEDQKLLVEKSAKHPHDRM